MDEKVTITMTKETAKHLAALIQWATELANISHVEMSDPNPIQSVLMCESQWKMWMRISLDMRMMPLKQVPAFHEVRHQLKED